MVATCHEQYSVVVLLKNVDSGNQHLVLFLDGSCDVIKYHYSSQTCTQVRDSMGRDLWERFLICESPESEWVKMFGFLVHT